MSLSLIHRINFVNRNFQKKLHSILKNHRRKRNYSLQTMTPENVATVGTIKDVRAKTVQIMGVQKGYTPLVSSRAHLIKYLPASQQELPPRKMRDSFASALVPLSTNFELQEKYVTFLGHVRIGRLLEDMDMFAVYIAYKHILNPNQPKDTPSSYTLVTVLVDKIVFTDYVPKPNEDIRLSGHVSWVGTSSIEVVVCLEQKSHGHWERITKALFLMAARDPTALKAAVVNPLIATNNEEREILSGGEARKKHRQLLQTVHLTKVIPNSEEQNIIHDLFTRTLDFGTVRLSSRKLPEGCTWMENCTLSTVVIPQPENRNLHNKVFGGFLMRQAMEISWCLGYMFTKFRPTIKSISDISFSRAVEVNSLIRMHAHVVFTEKQYFQIVVYAETWDPVSGKTDTSNAFHFTFEVPQIPPVIFPHTYHEAMMYIDGRRHFLNVMQTVGNKNQDALNMLCSL